MKRIGLVGAMDMEIAPILKIMENAQTVFAGPFAFLTGEIAGVPVIAGRCGIGKVNAAMAVQALLSAYDISLVVHVGVGGSLTEWLGIGDIVVGEDCVQYDVDTTALGDPPGFVSTVNRIAFPCDIPAAEKILKSAQKMQVKTILGRIATGDRFLTDSEEKRAIVDTFGALTCDQESCAVAQVCWINRIPCAVIRSVSDAEDGNHASEYENCAPLAAKNASNLAIRFMKEYGKQFI